MVVRKANSTDTVAIQGLSAQLGYDCALADLELRFEEIQMSQEHQIYVAEDHSAICGYIHINIYKSLYFENTLNIMGLVVDSCFRGRGIGSALLEKSGEFALYTGCSGIRAFSGSQRSKAHDFYIKNRFDYINDKKLFVKKV